MADDAKPAPVWVHHPPSGRTQQVSAAAWAAGDLAADGWVVATAEQVAVITPPPLPPAEPDPGPARSRRR